MQLEPMDTQAIAEHRERRALWREQGERDERFLRDELGGRRARLFVRRVRQGELVQHRQRCERTWIVRGWTQDHTLL